MNTEAETDASVPPANGWCCFHCGERFPSTHRGVREAREHFGPTPDWEPACVERWTKSDGALQKLARKARMREHRAWERTRKAEEEAENLGCELSSWRHAIKGATTVNEVRCALESMEGRALAAEAVLGELQRTAPAALLAASIAVCGPGTYFPLPQLKGIEVVTWVSVEQEMPDADTTVAITLDPATATEPAWLGHFDGHVWRDTEGSEVRVLYWANMLRGGLR